MPDGTRTFPPTYARPLDEAYERIDSLGGEFDPESEYARGYSEGIAAALAIITGLGGQRPNRILLTPRVEINPFDGMSTPAWSECQRDLDRLAHRLDDMAGCTVEPIRDGFRYYSDAVADALADGVLEPIEGAKATVEHLRMQLRTAAEPAGRRDSDGADLAWHLGRV